MIAEMQGHRSVADFVHDSTVLGRRVKLDVIPLLTDADLNLLQLEVFNATQSIDQQLKCIDNNETTEGWVYRARSALRYARIFSAACVEEKKRRFTAFQAGLRNLSPEDEKLWQDQRMAQKEKRRNDELRQLENIRKKKARVRNHVLRMEWESKILADFLIDEWGKEEAGILLERARMVAKTLAEIAVDSTPA